EGEGEGSAVTAPTVADTGKARGTPIVAPVSVCHWLCQCRGAWWREEERPLTPALSPQVGRGGRKTRPLTPALSPLRRARGQEKGPDHLLRPMTHRNNPAHDAGR